MTKDKLLENISTEILVALKERIADRNRIKDEIASIEVSRSKLEPRLSAETAIEAELSGLAAIEAAELESWAQSGVGPEPAPKSQERAKLRAKLAEANHTAAAARTAQNALASKSEALLPQYVAAQAAVRAAALPVVEAKFKESLHDLLDALKSQDRAIANSKGAVAAAYEVCHAHLERDPNGAKLWAQFGERAEAAIRAMVGPEPVGNSEPWHSLFAELTEGAQ